jgi:hypothetical protein
MDNEKGMKLIKILVKARGGFYKEFNTNFQPRELLLEMKEISYRKQRGNNALFKEIPGAKSIALTNIFNW